MIHEAMIKSIKQGREREAKPNFFVINEQYYVSNISAKWPSQTHIEKS